MPFDASCPDCKIPGDDCPLGKLNFFIYSILNSTFEWDQQSAYFSNN